MAYRVSTKAVGGNKVYHLHDDDTGASASVLPSFGFNLFDLRLPAGGKVRPILAADPDFAANPKNAGRNGWPVLFPFPNRINGGKYEFGGQTFQVPTGGRPWAIHGFAIDANWEVLDHAATESGATIAGRYQIGRQTPGSLDYWPADAELEMRYTLAGQRLALSVSVSNLTAEKLPYGIGFHPYFRLPLDDSGDRAKTKVIVPADELWELADFIPTGARKPVDQRLDFRVGQPIKDLKLDDVLTGLRYDGDRGVCKLVDENLNCEVRLVFDRNIREMVLYTPPDTGNIISIEPYTCTTDAINLATRGIDGGLRVLGHDERSELTLSVETA
jgi:aldose 1-epimerase